MVWAEWAAWVEWDKVAVRPARRPTHHLTPEVEDITTITVTTGTMDMGGVLLPTHHRIHSTLKLAVNLKNLQNVSVHVNQSWLKYWTSSNKKNLELFYDW